MNAAGRWLAFGCIDLPADSATTGLGRIALATFRSEPPRDPEGPKAE